MSDQYKPVPIMVPLRPVPRAAETIARAEYTDTPHPRLAPIWLEVKAGRVSHEYGERLLWHGRIATEKGHRGESMSRAAVGGGRVPFNSRDPEALYAQEHAADWAMRMRKCGDLLGPLVEIIRRAIDGASMAELAPAGFDIPDRRKPEAGRIRLKAAIAALDAAGRWDVMAIVRQAADEINALVRKQRGGARLGAGRPVAANDNTPRRIAA